MHTLSIQPALYIPYEGLNLFGYVPRLQRRMDQGSGMGLGSWNGSRV